MKKAILPLLLSVLALFCFSARAAAAPEDEAFSKAFSALDEETSALLKDLGVDPSDLRSVFGVSASSVLQRVRALFSSGAGEFLKAVVPFLLFEALLGAALTFLGGKTGELVRRLGGVLLLLMLAHAGTKAVAAAASAVRLTQSMSLALIPIPVALSAARGRTLGAGLQTGVFAFAETLGFALAEGLLPLGAVGTALGAAAEVCPRPGLSRVGEVLFRGLTWALGVGAALFSAVLGLKGSLAMHADALWQKGAKILLGGALPIVGSAVGDALSSLSGALALSQGSVAMLGILAVCLVNLPALAALLSALAALFLLELATGFFSLPGVSDCLKVFSSLLKLLLAAVVFNAVVFVVALGLLAKME